MSESSLKFLNIKKGKFNDLNGQSRSNCVIIDINEDSSGNKIEITNESADDGSREKFEKWTFKYITIKDASEYLKFEYFQNKLNDIDQTIFVKFIINDNFENLKKDEFGELGKMCNTKAIVILFIEKNHKNLQIFWKSKDIDYFLMIKPYDKSSPEECKEVYGLAVDTLIHSLNNGHIGLQKSCIYNENSNLIELKQLADNRNYDLLQNAVELNELHIIKTLLKMDIFQDNPSKITNPQSIACKRKQYDIVLMFLEANFSYPPLGDLKNCPKEIIEFQDIDDSLHKAIKSKNDKKVRKILAENPTHRHFYNLENESALKIALQVKSFKIYKILIANNVTFGPHEEHKEIFGQDKAKIWKIHLSSTKDLPDNHVNIFMMNTSICHDETNIEDKQYYAKRAYEVLNKDPNTKIILRVVAAYRKFEVVFDFKRDSVEMVDPTASEDTKGIFYSNREKICIGAKQLLDPATEHETFGTLAHELCHFAIYLTFANLGKPYSLADHEMKENFKEICETYEKMYLNKKNEGDQSSKSSQENIVKMVYDNYGPSEHHAELIVRVPHLIAKCHNQPEKLAQEREKFPKLFDYYENFVVSEMEKALPAIEKLAKPISIRKVILIGLAISLAMMGILAYWLYPKDYKFLYLSNSEKNIVRNANVTYKNSIVKCNEIFIDDSTAYTSLDPEYIKKILEGEILSLDDPQLEFLDKMVCLSWGNLSDTLRHKAVNMKFSFQDEVLKLSELNILYPEILNYLSSEEIKSILDNKKMTIDQMITNSTNFYIERNFIPEIALEARMRYSSRNLSESFEEFHKEFVKYKTKNANAANSLVHNSVNSVRVNIHLQKLTTDFFLHQNLDDILNMTNRLFILSSEAGAGKTVIFEKMTVEMKKKYPVKWVSYIDLKNHTNLYKKIANSTNIEGMLEEIFGMTSKTKFEKEILRRSYSSGNTVFFWNGFDEISYNNREYLINIMSVIHNNTSNIQFICTRPSFSKNLTEKFNTDAYMLVPFNKSEQQTFLRKYLMANNNLTNLNADENANKLMTMMTKLTEKDNRAFDTPLMLLLVAETFDNANSANSINIYEMYERFADKKWKIWDQKRIRYGNSKHAAGSLEEASRIFQKYAVKVEIFTFAFFIHPSLRSLEAFSDNAEKLNFAEISQLGILHINSETDFMFAHKTFAEFFIAQYLIQNIYEFDKKGISDSEVDARLELFFLTFQLDSTFENVLEFVESYLDVNQNTTGKFNKIIANILKVKYKNYLVDILNKPAKSTFRIFFKFFKKDKDLLVELLKVNQDETFYTSLFNPFYDSKFIDPNEVRNLTKNLLNVTEFEKFINGKNQMGIRLFGLFYKLDFSTLNNYGLKITKITDFWEFYDMLKSGSKSLSFDLTAHETSTILAIQNNEIQNLTKKELKQLFTNPVVTFIYRKYSSGSLNNKKFWFEVENLFEPSELKNFIGNMLAHLFRPQLGDVERHVEVELLHSLIEKANNLLSSLEVFNMADEFKILYRSGRNSPQFKIIWDFLANHTSSDQKRKLLLYDYKKEEEYLLRNFDNDNEQNFYSVYYKFFMMTPKIFHLIMFQDNFTEAFPLVTKIYEENFKKSEIQNIVMQSNDFIFPLIFTRTEEICNTFGKYLENLFKENESSLKNLLNSNFKDTSSSVFEYFNGLSSFSFGDRENLIKRLQIFSKLKSKLN